MSEQNEVICTLTQPELDEISARFTQYENSGDTTNLDEYMKGLGIKYGFDPKKVSVTENGKVRNVF